jgi:uncharacterized protein YjbI with pentapeptide repeats
MSDWRDSNKWGDGSDEEELRSVLNAIRDDGQKLVSTALTAISIMNSGTLTMAKLRDIESLLDSIETHASIPLSYAQHHFHNLKTEREANTRCVTKKYILEKGANLECADLEELGLSFADLEGANLEDANLRRATLIRANLKDANLINANLSGADLTGADLTGANLEGANFTGACLTDVKLHGAKIRDVVWPVNHPDTINT